MTIDAERFQRLLSNFKLAQLFNELGWDHASLHPQEITIASDTFTLSAIAQKRGVAVLLCSPDSQGEIPARAILLKIEKEATKLAHEHLLIFTDAGKTTLTWLWVLRAPGQPAATRTHTWHKGTSGESLRQKLNQIVWSLDEEEAITLTDVITGLRRAFDRDKVSKTFYTQFKAEHEAFASFIEGVTAAADQAWYASLMLNRLMFVYFIQRKGFLDANINYLSERMQMVRDKAGEGHFHSFYRLFLRRLFHEGLGLPKGARGTDLVDLIGDVPYLNGGLFDVHELEETYPDIDIPDEAFEKLFNFFDAYDWHLDDRPLSTGNEINPDVLGYIFEKYINQKQMGAYYTKEDITEYISKSTVIPFLLERTRERCNVAFDGEASVFNLLKSDPDRYLYPALKTGVIDVDGEIVPEAALPGFVQAGMKEANTRMLDHRYNLGEALFDTPAGNNGTLPTETWREYVERRTRCLAARARLANGEIESADELIALNLDVRQFMQDVIDTSTGPDLLRAVWQAIVGSSVPGHRDETYRHGIAILDPTCGSGAFLFAALNILEPLYEACLDRMEGFLEDARKLGKSVDTEFASVLDEVSHHHSRRYFIYKTIILHNLFGVDIMPEAVEICKLRLFLKLVSQVESGQGLEPLPDIDFNIRAGNALVGYATETQFDAARNLASDETRRENIKSRFAELARLSDRFREQQTVHGGNVTSEDKRALRERLGGLSLELDRYLAYDYGIDLSDVGKFASWRESHQPFHWLAEFYNVMHEGGFDVVIGNPPYVEFKDMAVPYGMHGYDTYDCKNLYAVCSERGLQIANPLTGTFGFIVPVASTCTDRYASLKSKLISAGRCFVSSYNDRPGRLFDGLEHIRLSIIIVHVGKSGVHTTKYNKWNSAARENLFPLLQYQVNDARHNWEGSLPKIGTQIEKKLLDLVRRSAQSVGTLTQPNRRYSIYYTRKLSGFVQILDFVPSITDDSGNARPPSELKKMTFASDETAKIALALLNATTFYWFLTIYSDVRNLNKREVLGLPLAKVNPEVAAQLAKLAEDLMESFQSTSNVREMRYKNHGTLHIQCIFPKLSKQIIDDIDLAYGRAIGFDDEMLDFIVNYDIKYRMSGTDGSNAEG